MSLMVGCLVLFFLAGGPALLLVFFGFEVDFCGTPAFCLVWGFFFLVSIERSQTCIGFPTYSTFMSEFNITFFWQR